MKIVTRNRSGNLIEFRRLDDERWLVVPDDDVDVSAVGFSDHHIDFAGGPYIGVGMPLSELDGRLPDDEIVKVGFDCYAEDKAGFQFYGYVIYTQPLQTV